MSYQLVFWSQQPGEPSNPQQVCERLMEGEAVDGLEELPGDRILSRIAEAFSQGWERLDDLNWERSDGSFQVEIGLQYFLIESYSLPGEVLNQFIDIGAEFGTKLYGPQVGERFEG